VLKAAGAGDPQRVRKQLFYAHLYLGLYYEAAGDTMKARDYIFKAAEAKVDDYMGEVARVHAERLRH
jgi:lipoprotein NlpI